jgi:hypothetical protein
MDTPASRAAERYYAEKKVMDDAQRKMNLLAISYAGPSDDAALVQAVSEYQSLKLSQFREKLKIAKIVGGPAPTLE